MLPTVLLSHRTISQTSTSLRQIATVFLSLAFLPVHSLRTSNCDPLAIPLLTAVMARLARQVDLPTKILPSARA